MKSNGLLSRILVGAAIVSTTISSSPVMAAGLTAPASQQAVQPVADVSLAKGGIFRGHVVGLDGQPIAGSAVVLTQGDRRLAETVSDESGAFAFQGVTGGTYAVSAAESTAVYRLWADQTAPPKARNAALLVKDGEVVRGNLGNASGIVVTTLVVGGLTWGIIEILDDDSGS